MFVFACLKYLKNEFCKAERERERNIEGWCLGPNEQREPND